LNLEGMEKLNKLLVGTKILILSDEVYEHLIFDGQKHESLAKFPNLRDKSIIVSSFGKTYNATGWKLGYCIANEDITKEIRKIHQFNVFSVNTPLQHAVAEFIDKKEAYLEIGAFYQQKRDEFLSLLKGSKFSYTPSQGTYFQILNFKDISDEKDADFANRLIKEYKLATIPVSAFYHKAFDSKELRFCFAKTTDTLKKAAEILHKVK
jgi:methionine transaminase